MTSFGETTRLQIDPAIDAAIFFVALFRDFIPRVIVGMMRARDGASMA
jgi:hypothetical protein